MGFMPKCHEVPPCRRQVFVILDLSLTYDDLGILEFQVFWYVSVLACYSLEGHSYIQTTLLTSINLVNPLCKCNYIDVDLARSGQVEQGKKPRPTWNGCYWCLFAITVYNMK